jgi:LysM repeat protein
METALIYTVVPGDSIYHIAASIAGAAGISVTEVMKANPGLKPDALQVGAELKLPSVSGIGGPLRYTMHSGDTLFGICAALSGCSNMTVEAIEDANPDLNPDKILPGQLLKIPAMATRTAPEFTTDAQHQGYWAWTYSQSAVPTNATMSLAFSGWADLPTALQDSEHRLGQLKGEKYLCVGGGNHNGAFTLDNLTALTKAIARGKCAGYHGIAYDVEEGDAGLASEFATSFATAKAKGFKVLVTVSHSAPYGMDDAASLMQCFFDDANIDFISPQLYTTGTESANDYSISHGVDWSSYAGAKAVVLPSVVNACLYDAAKGFFAGQGVQIQGFIQWAQC